VRLLQPFAVPQLEKITDKQAENLLMANKYHTKGRNL